jgi:hypothetical protein
LDPQVSDIPLSNLVNTPGEVYRALVIGFAFALARDIEIARRINFGTSLMEKGSFGSTLSAIDAKGLFLIAQHVREKQAPYRQLTIHRYQPRTALSGIFGWFNFERKFITDLIEHGFTDAVEHDCERNGCVLPN